MKTFCQFFHVLPALKHKPALGFAVLVAKHRKYSILIYWGRECRGVGNRYSFYILPQNRVNAMPVRVSARKNEEKSAKRNKKTTPSGGWYFSASFLPFQPK